VRQQDEPTPKQEKNTSDLLGHLLSSSSSSHLSPTAESSSRRSRHRRRCRSNHSKCGHGPKCVLCSCWRGSKIRVVAGRRDQRAPISLIRRRPFNFWDECGQLWWRCVAWLASIDRSIRSIGQPLLPSYRPTRPSLTSGDDMIRAAGALRWGETEQDHGSIAVWLELAATNVWTTTTTTRPAIPKASPPPRAYRARGFAPVDYCSCH
jgi:hypothetical protein